MKHVIIAPALLLLGLSPLGAATIPYSNNFSGVGSNTAFTSEITDTEWTVSSGGYQYVTSNTTYTASTASVAVTNASGMDFTMQTQFTINTSGSVNANGATIGFGLFGATPGFSGTNSSSAYYLADFQYGNSGTPGALRILSLGNTTGFTGSPTSVDNNPGSPSLAALVGTTYTLRLTGVYTGTTLNMTLGLFDATGTTQIGTSATGSDTSVLTGTNFGYRNRIGLGGGTANITFDNFSITTSTIPEPGSVAAMMGGAAMFAALAMRRRARR